MTGSFLFSGTGTLGPFLAYTVFEGTSLDLFCSLVSLLLLYRSDMNNIWFSILYINSFYICRITGMAKWSFATKHHKGWTDWNWCVLCFFLVRTMLRTHVLSFRDMFCSIGAALCQIFDSIYRMFITPLQKNKKEKLENWFLSIFLNSSRRQT